jgi:hypothetical protein
LKIASSRKAGDGAGNRRRGGLVCNERPVKIWSPSCQFGGSYLV